MEAGELPVYCVLSTWGGSYTAHVLSADAWQLRASFRPRERCPHSRILEKGELGQLPGGDGIAGRGGACNPTNPHVAFFFFLINLFLFLAALGLRCCARAFSSCGERGLLFVAVRRLLIAVASLVAEHGL